MARPLSILALVLGITQILTAGEAAPKPLVRGLKNLSAIAVGSDGRIYAAVRGGNGAAKAGGEIVVVKQGKAIPFAKGLDEPSAIASYQKWLFVADRDRIRKFDLTGKSEVFVAPNAFPFAMSSVGSMTADPESGTLYAVGAGKNPVRIAVFRITPKGKVDVIVDSKSWFALGLPCGLAMDGASHLLVTDPSLDGFQVSRVTIANGAHEAVTHRAGGLINASGLAWDMHGRLFAAGAGKIWAAARPGSPLVMLEASFGMPMAICLDPMRRSLLVADATAGAIHVVPAAVPGQPVDETPLPLETAVAFPNLKWTGWQGETDAGKIVPLRPIVLTHAGDGSNRVFVATQHGVIHVFPNDQKAKATKVFLDIESQVRYDDKQNEEGLLGLAFHPEYKKTGEFFVFYTPKNQKLVNVVSRFRVSKDDPNKADPASEEIIFSVKRPFWNHDGGTICFGPDGCLYIALGDGGAANDPHDNGQNLKTHLGDILRIDVNKKDPGKKYAIPPDNPLAGNENALPEIWAYGLRNVWRMAFDKKTGKLWAGDVGQNLYEEINIIEKGGNYGWRRREGLHPFGADGKGHGPAYIDPIWEYHHDIGKSITGGHVYRGKALPELEGHYVYGDYVSSKIWALRYDETAKRVVANRPIRDRGMPILSFGEDEQGDVYLLTYSAAGRGIYQFVRTKK
ncbi:MAG: PQQ-dependent sugar dehydrogenase [Gemmataceae bacterium]|nr:PQQ-dependent sugar dehydrogenase [Gemmataceae bacterium]